MHANNPPAIDGDCDRRIRDGAVADSVFVDIGLMGEVKQIVIQQPVISGDVEIACADRPAR